MGGGVGGAVSSSRPEEAVASFIRNAVDESVSQQMQATGAVPLEEEVKNMDFGGGAAFFNASAFDAARARNASKSPR